MHRTVLVALALGALLVPSVVLAEKRDRKIYKELKKKGYKSNVAAQDRRRALGRHQRRGTRRGTSNYNPQRWVTTPPKSPRRITRAEAKRSSREFWRTNHGPPGSLINPNGRNRPGQTTTRRAPYRRPSATRRAPYRRRTATRRAPYRRRAAPYRSRSARYRSRSAQVSVGSPAFRVAYRSARTRARKLSLIAAERQRLYRKARTVPSAQRHHYHRQTMELARMKVRLTR